ncbi:MAG: hypothetical protein Q8K63_00720, partial [Acidimicrobiales bacterium]|nr:hypothetical protein [Acidimicrobiales bacterium]
MRTTTAPAEPVPVPPRLARSVGATWVAATGAALVLVAAGVLVASRWDRLADVVKLGILMAGTGLCIGAGRRVTPTLPATGNVVFHLGMLLIPANVAAVLVHHGASLGQHLVAQGAIGAVVFGLAAHAVRSRTLEWASYVAVPLFAFGVGALTPVPGLLVLAVCAITAEAVPQLKARDAVVPWAMAAGFGPSALILFASMVSPETAADASAALQITGASLGATAWSIGLAAGGVLAYRARKTESVDLALTAVALVVFGMVHTALAARVGEVTGLLGGASAFVLVETLALYAQSDRFWRKPAAIVVGCAEVLAAFVYIPVSVAVIVLSFMTDSGANAGMALALLTVGAGVLIADARRATIVPRPLLGGNEAGFAAGLIAMATTAGLLCAGVPSVTAGVVLAAMCAGFVATRRSATLLVLGAGPVAIALAYDTNQVVASGVGLVIAGCAAYLCRTPTTSDRQVPWSALLATA